jgi:RNase P subunit RPR2
MADNKRHICTHCSSQIVLNRNLDEDSRGSIDWCSNCGTLRVYVDQYGGRVEEYVPAMLKRAAEIDKTTGCGIKMER